MVVITAGIADVNKKSSVRISLVGHSPSVTVWFLDDILTDHLFSYEQKTTFALLLH